MLHRTIGSIVPVHQCTDTPVHRYTSARNEGGDGRPIEPPFACRGRKSYPGHPVGLVAFHWGRTFGTFCHPNIIRHCPVQVAVVPSDPSRVTPRGSGLCVLGCLWGESSRGILLTLEASSCLPSPRLPDPPVRAFFVPPVSSLW